MSDSEDDVYFRFFQADLSDFQPSRGSDAGTALTEEVSHVPTSRPAIPAVIDDSLADVFVDQMYADPILQTFYEGPKKCDCCPNWVEKPPLQPPEHAKFKYEAAAIILFHKKDHRAEKAVIGGLIKTTPWAVEIQSEVLNEILRPILDKLGPKADKEKKLRIQAPFRTLFFAYPEVQSVLSRETKWMRRKHIELLLQVLDSLFKDISAEVKALHSKRTITWDYLWTLFPQNIIVISTVYGPDRLFQVERWDGNVVGSFVQFNGVSFRKSFIGIGIPYFAGARPITSLPVYPVGFHHDPDLESSVYQRALKVLKIQRFMLVDHRGWAIDSPRSPAYKTSKLLSGRVMIDAFGMDKHVQNSTIRRDEDDSDPSDLDLSDSDSEDLIHSTEQTRKVAATSNGVSSKRRLNVAEQERNYRSILRKRERVLILSPYLPGYSMDQNKWMWFYIQDLRLVRWNENAYRDLVYDENYKTLLHSCVQHHSAVSRYSDDVIRGKGRGMVILLSGPSGTGKTLTAEALAERLELPLLRLQASSFGDPRGIKVLLQKAFELCEEWNVPLLIDEADDFIRKRTQGDDFANGMLRHIEYFKGIVFLTANLYNNIDEAFRSRVHVHVPFTNLGFSARLLIWGNFIVRLKASLTDRTSRGASGLPDVHVNEIELQKLAEWELNGREIKNIVKTSFVNCAAISQPLDYERLEAGIKFTSPFAKRGDDIEASHLDSQSAGALNLVASSKYPLTHKRRRL